MDLKIGILASSENEVIDEISNRFGDAVKTVVYKETKDEDIADILEGADVNIIVLAGYPRRISDNIISKYPGRILNIHPSLLPKFAGKGMYGKAIHKAVIESGDKKSGVTIHVVEGDYDVGRIVSQEEIMIDGADIDSLIKKTLDLEKGMVCDVLEKFGSTGVL